MCIYTTQNPTTINHHHQTSALHSYLDGRAVNKPEEQHGNSASSEPLMRATAQLHDSMWSPEHDQHLGSLSQSARKDDNNRDSDRYLCPHRGLMDGDWWREKVPCQAEQHHHRGVAAVMRTDSGWRYSYSCHVDSKKQHSCRKTRGHPCADVCRPDAFPSVCVSSIRNHICELKKKTFCCFLFICHQYYLEV